MVWRAEGKIVQQLPARWRQVTQDERGCRGPAEQLQGPKKKQLQHDKWGLQEELPFVQNGEEEKKANAMKVTKCHVCNKEGHWGDECPNLSPEEQHQRKKDSKERWASAKKNCGQQHTQVGEVIDAYCKNCDGGAGDVENIFFMLAAGKKNVSETM